MAGEKMRKYLYLPSRPVWDRDGGIWYVSPTISKDKPTPMYRHYPSINNICEPLIGASVHSMVEAKVFDADGKVMLDVDGKEVTEQKYKIVGVCYPTPKRRHQIYREALELVLVRRRKSDLLNLAVYRRQVTKKTDIPLDELFLVIGDLLDISRDGWANLAERMPKGTEVHKACLHRAKTGRASRSKKT